MIPNLVRRRWGAFLSAGILLVLLLGVGLVVLARLRVQQALRAALAETEALDPKWRFADLDAARPQVPDEENAALLVIRLTRLWDEQDEQLRANKLDPTDGITHKELADFLLNHPANQFLPPTILRRVRQSLRVYPDILGEARQFQKLTRFRYPDPFNERAHFAAAGYRGDVEALVRLLLSDALVQAHEGQIATALVDWHAAVSAARTQRDLPFLVTVLYQAQDRVTLVEYLERLLALGEPSADDLVRLAKVLEDEELAPLWVEALRSERPLLLAELEMIKNGQLALPVMLGVGRPTPQRVLADALDAALVGSLQAAEPALLRRSNRLCRISTKPFDEQWPEIQAEIKRLAHEPLYVRLLATAIDHCYRAQREAITMLRCMRTGVALERYRRDQGRWPDQLAELVPTYLPLVPLDTMDRLPLKYRRTASGVIVYSIGPDEVDNSGTLKRWSPNLAGSDRGIELFDPAQRRAAPPPEDPYVEEPLAPHQPD